MPNFVRWKKIAPLINPRPVNAPGKVVRGIKIRMAAISSATPVPILPQGSMPSALKSCTDSGCAVNLKYKVCSKIKAAINRKTQVKIVLTIMLHFKSNLRVNVRLLLSAIPQK